LFVSFFFFLGLGFSLLVGLDPFDNGKQFEVKSFFTEGKE